MGPALHGQRTQSTQAPASATPMSAAGAKALATEQGGAASDSSPLLSSLLLGLGGVLPLLTNLKKVPQWPTPKQRVQVVTIRW